MLENRQDDIEAAMENVAAEDTIHAVSLVSHTGEYVYGSEAAEGETVSIDDGRCSGCHAGGAQQPLRRLPSDEYVSIKEEARVAEVAIPVYNEPACYAAECHAHSPEEGVLGIMQIDVSYAAIDRSPG